MTFDAEYFTELLNETLAMSEDLSRNYNEDLSEKMHANALALSYLSEKIEDEEAREATRSRLRRFFKETGGTRRRKKEEGANDGERAALEDDLLEYARKLKEKARELGRKLEEDEEVVEKTGKNFQRSVAQTRTSVVGANEVTAFSLPQIFIFSFVVFLFMYILIRFF